MKVHFLMRFTLVSVLTLTACGPSTGQQRAEASAEQQAQTREAFVPKNGIEFKNYNERQRIADNPTTILWCTSSFPIPNSPLFTIPVVGKLTSGNKRPFPATTVNTSLNESTERPGPDGMYGSSGEYRYGFTPGGVYADWYNISTFCTTEPMVWQREKTTIVMEIDSTLLRAHQAARQALARNDTAGAVNALTKAITHIGAR